MSWTFGAASYELETGADGLPVVYAAPGQPPILHDYGVDDLARVLVPLTLEAVHAHGETRVGEFHDAGGHPLFVGLRRAQRSPRWGAKPVQHDSFNISSH